MKKNLPSYYFYPLHYIKLFCISILCLIGLSVQGQAVLPAYFNGPWATSTNPAGYSQTGLAADLNLNYGGTTDGNIATTKVANFNTAGDQVTIQFAEVPGTLTYYLASRGTSSTQPFNGTFVVEESGNGSVYNPLQTVTNTDLTTPQLFTYTPATTTRYIRFRFVSQPTSTITMTLDKVRLLAKNQEINVKLGAADKLTGSTHTFADQNVKTTSTAVPFTIQNGGSADLNVSDLTLTGEHADQFVLTKPASISPLTPGGAITFTVAFSPKTNTPDLKQAAVSIASNDTDENPYIINLSGRAVIRAPVISSISPTSGAVGSTVTINGTNLINTTAVTFNGEAARFTFISDVRITAIVPAAATTGPIAVTNETGSATSQVFTITPAITSLSPTAGAFNAPVTIKGTNLSEVTSVKFNGTEVAAFTIVSAMEITTAVPVGATTGKVTVTSAVGTGISSQTFTVYQPPTITSLESPEGVDAEGIPQATIGTIITINGTNFTSAATVKFPNNITVAKTFVSSTQLTVVVPVGTASGLITVTTVGGTASASFIFINTTYVWNAASGDWAEPNNWTPARTSINNKDILIFDGNNTTPATTFAVTLNFAAPEAIGQLIIRNKAAVTFTVAEDKILNIGSNIPGTDFSVASGSSLTVTNSATDADLILDLQPNETGLVVGVLSFQGSATASHRFLSKVSLTGSGNLVFQNLSFFVAGANLIGSPFGEAIPNSVVFSSGASYINQSGGSPFGGAGIPAVVVFNFGSTYRHEVNAAPDLAGRIYGHFTINNAAFNQTVEATDNLFIRNNFTQTAATTFNLKLAGTTTIGGVVTINGGTFNYSPAAAATFIIFSNVAVNRGALNLVPLAASTIRLNGVGARTISGAGTLNVGPNANLAFEEKGIYTLSKNIGGTGQITVSGRVRTANVNGLNKGSATSFVSTLQVALNPKSTVEYFGTGAQVITNNNYANLIISGARGGKTVTLPSTLKIAEVFSPVATNVIYNTTGNTIEFNGAAQTVPVFSYNNLTVSGTGNKTLAGNITVPGKLELAGTNIITGNNTLTLAPAATIVGEANGQYVVGILATTRNVGSAGSDFGGMGIELGSGVDVGTVNVIRTSGPGSSVTVDTYTGINRKWEVNPSVQPATPISVTLSWVAGDDNGKDLSTARVWKTNGLTNPDGTPQYIDVSKADQNASSRTITASVSSFSTLTVSDQNNPLPVELISFKAISTGNQAILNWETASELNNAGFAVEVSTDAKQFREVGFVASKNPNSSTIQSYNFTHRANTTGTVYYRLKQTDWNGKFKYYGPRAVRFDRVAGSLLVYPNPVTATKELTVIVNGAGNQVASLNLTDYSGKSVYSKTHTFANNKLQLNLKGRDAGVYVLTVTTATDSYRVKVIIQ